MRKYIFIILALCSLSLYSQSVTQPKIMVIPYTTENENIRTILEKDPNKRIILTKIKEAFDERGFSTIDFVGRLKAMESGNVLNSDNKEDIKSLIIDMSGADIYVEAEMVYNASSTGNSVKIILTAYDVAGGSSLANKVGESGKFYTNDVGALSIRAIKSIAGDFLNTMQQKFLDISENGKSIMLQIGFDNNSPYTMESEISGEGLMLQDLIELWLEELAYQGDYHIQGVSPLKMVVDDIKIPLVDKNGKNYTTSQFSRDLLKKFHDVGLPITRTTRLNTLYITIK